MSQEAPIEEPVVETPTPPAVDKYLDDTGKFTEEFRNSLPDDLGKHSVFDKYGNFTEMVKGTINAQDVIGKKAAEFWSSEDANDIVARKQIMGVPETKEDYVFNKPDLPETIDAEMVNELIGSAQEKFLEVGLSKDQAAALLEWDMQNLVNMAEQRTVAEQTAKDEAEAALKAEWKGEKYDYNVSKVTDALTHLKGDKFFQDPTIASNPEFIKWAFENIVPLVDDDAIVSARQAESYATVTDALTEVEGKMNRFIDGGGSNNDPQYRMWIKERGELLQKIVK